MKTKTTDTSEPVKIRMGIDMEHYYEITASTKMIPPTTAPKKKRSPTEMRDRRHFRDMTIWLNNCLTLAQQVELTDTKELIALLEQARNAIPKVDA
jgi:hypothetical protein